MPPHASGRLRSFSPLTLLLAAACGGGSGDGGSTIVTPPVAAAVAVSGPTGTIVAFGRTRQYSAVVSTAGGAPITGATVTWASSNTAVATINGSGLATVVGNGSTNITATSGAIVSPAAVLTAQQLTATVTVTSPNGLVDTVRTRTRTRQYTATAKDSGGSAIAGAVFGWQSSNTAVGTVDGAGLVTAGATTGTTTITATSSGVQGTFAFATALYPATFTVSPPTANITTAAGTQLFSVVAQDSVGTNITSLISWLSRTPAVLTVSPATGTTTTGTAVGNGSTRVVVSAAGRVDSSTVTVTGQGSTAPNAVGVSVGDFFFTSGHNPTSNPAVDTVAVGGTVTWTWGGGASHSVQSTGAPSFTNSPTKAGSGTYQFTFNTAGTYQYICGIHGASMSGQVVVR